MSLDRSPSDDSGPARLHPAKRGFAAMDPRRRREISSLGGRAAHASGNAHEFDSAEARAAGLKRHGKQERDASGG